ncbi:hypothetical protein [Listeria valentina]|nr:hypothetical protein [Listeria valentina]
MDLVTEAGLTDTDVERIKKQLANKKTVQGIECNSIPKKEERNHSPARK